MTEYIVLLIGNAERMVDRHAPRRRRKAAFAVHGRFADELGARGPPHHRRRRAATARREARTVAPHADHRHRRPVGRDAPSRSVATTSSSTDDLDDLMECCQILAATGDAVEVRRCVQPEERAS